MEDINLVALKDDELIETSGGSWTFGNIVLGITAYYAFMAGVEEATCDANPGLCDEK